MILDNYIRRTNMFSLVFLISFGILMNVSASSVEGLNLYVVTNFKIR